MRNVRSALYVPGDAPAKVEKSLSRDCDVVIVDLEDAVAPSRKEQARNDVARWLSSLSPPTRGRPQIWVRVNPGAACPADVDAVAGPALSGICLAKAESVEEIELVDDVLTRAERRRGPTVGTIRVQPVLETARAVLRAEDLAGAPRVSSLQIGEADLAADLGVTQTSSGEEMAWARGRVVMVSAASGLAMPIAPVRADYRDLEAFRRSTEHLRSLGFFGRVCIHPAQAVVAHEVFAVADDELRRARALLDRFDAATAAGVGVVTDDEGRMVDEAVVRQARRTVEQR